MNQTTQSNFADDFEDEDEDDVWNTVEEPPSDGERRGLKVLAVEDERVSLRLLVRALEKDGHEVRTACDGKEALAMVAEEQPQLIVTDWMMPEVDGVELCRALREDPKGRGIYVLLLTSREEEDRIVEALDAGADDYVVKTNQNRGLNTRVLLARVRAGQRIVELREEVEREKRKLRAAALTDVLTQLPNRRYAMKRLEQEVARLRRDGGELSVMMLDIDFFKKVNDTYGHDVGDEVLRETADVLRETTRTGDVVCRLGGEEFLVICAGSRIDLALQSAERIRSSIEAHKIDFGPEERSVTVSIGVAECPSHAWSVDQLLKAADEWVYAAKARGRNQVCSEEQPDHDQRRTA